MTNTPTAKPHIAPVSLTLWGCGIILVWWAVVLSALGTLAWLAGALVRLVTGA